MSATVRKWGLIYLAILVTMILIAKYPYLLRGEIPHFSEREFLNTIIMAGLGTGLIEIIFWRWGQLRGRFRQKSSK